jgi:hypothetical protein
VRRGADRVAACLRDSRAMSASAHLPLPAPLRRYPDRPWADRTWRRWTAAWLGGTVLAIGNGVAREALYADRVGDLAAHQISTATFLALFAAYFAALERRWPIATTRRAVEIGATWVLLTVGFEFGFGHWVDGKSWSELLENYDLASGHLFVLVLLWVGVGPAVVRALRRA